MSHESYDREEKMIDRYQDFYVPEKVIQPNSLLNCYGKNIFCISIFEAIGMFCFVMSIGWTSGYGLYIGLYFSLMLMVNVSGSHYNPNVTIAQFLCFKGDSESLTKLLMYIIAQFVGTAGAIMLTYRLTNNTKIIAPVVYSDTGTMNALLQEFFWGGLLIFTNLYVCHPKTSPSKYTWVNVAIFNSILFYDITAIAHMTGASLNPAIAITGNFIGLYIKGTHDFGSFGRSMWINSLGPFLGSLVFTYIFRHLCKKIYWAYRKSVLITCEASYNMKIAIE